MSFGCPQTCSQVRSGDAKYTRPWKQAGVVVLGDVVVVVVFKHW